MNNIGGREIFIISKDSSKKSVVGTAVLDLGDDGGILNIEVYGLSHLIGRAPTSDEIAWMKNEVVDAFFSEEDDVLSVVVGFGENRRQRSSLAIFGFSEFDQLVSFSIAPE
ncbi:MULTISPECIES: hypothetical protein [Xanthomonas]|uniref:hypothetical protein n=1 Tax=Xanthomonas TaxID=338 RepID=UPI0012FE8918|nr:MULTISPECIES: hypothetical protein [Xanthomonas]